MKKRRAIILILVALALIFVMADVFFDLGILFSGESLEKTLREFHTYEYGSHDENLLRLKSHVSKYCRDISMRKECERLFLAFLESEATLTSKMEICRFLRIMGSDSSIPVLERLIRSNETSDMARYALENIPGRAVDEAWLRLLANAPDNVLPGVISSIGHRRINEAVSGLGKLLQNTDPSIVSAAVIALGRIASPEAVSLLNSANNGVDLQKQMQVTGSLLKCAEELHSRNENQKAVLIYDQILVSDVPLSLRRAALKGKILSSGGKAKKIILDVLERDVEALGPIAISLVPRVFESGDIHELCERLSRLSNSNQVQLLTALGTFRNPEVIKTAASSLTSPYPDVRIAALDVLGKIGDASMVEVLARYATQSGGNEKMTARHSLWHLKGEGVDRAILEALENASDPYMKTELIRSLAERRVSDGKELLIELSQKAEINIRLSAISALGVIAHPTDIPVLIDFLLMTDDDYERREIMETVAKVAEGIDRLENRAARVEKRLAKAKTDRERNLLYRTIGRIGDNRSLPILRKALRDPSEMIQKTAVNVLANWPDPTPRDDMFHVAKTSHDSTHQVLALRGYIRMIRMQEFSSPEEGVKLLEAALQLAKRPEEKRYILGTLPQFACRKGLKVAESLLQDDAVRAEAKLAVNKIEKELRKSGRAS